MAEVESESSRSRIGDAVVKAVIIRTMTIKNMIILLVEVF